MPIGMYISLIGMFILCLQLILVLITKSKISIMNTETTVRTERKKLIDNYWIVALLFVLYKLILHLLTNTNYELHRDEMLYFNMADYLSSGYATVPPVTGFMAYIVKSIFGYSVFGIRFFPALFGSATVFILAKIIRELGGGIPSLVIASLAYIFSPGFLLLDSLFTPNFIEHFIWLLITYLLIRMITQNKPVLWILIGVLTGIGFLTKYSILFFVVSFVIAILPTRHNKLFLSRYFLFALVVAFLIFLPNILWQYNHGWPVVTHMSDLKRTQLDIYSNADFFLDIFSLTSGFTLLWVGGLLSLIFLKKERQSRYLGAGSFLLILFFLISGGKAYYIMAIIPFLFAIGGLMIEKYLKAWLLIPVSLLYAVTLLYSLVSLPFALPVLPFNKLNTYREKTENFIIYPFYRWEDGKVHNISQAFTDMTGWNELAGKVAEAYNMLPQKDREKCMIFLEENYGDAGAIHFYGKKYGLPEPVTFQESYVFWAPDTIPDGPVIYVHFKPGGFEELYYNIKDVGVVEDIYFRETGLKVFLCTSPKENVPEVYRKHALEKKKLFTRKLK